MKKQFKIILKYKLIYIIFFYLFYLINLILNKSNYIFYVKLIFSLLEFLKIYPYSLKINELNNLKLRTKNFDN